MKPVRCGDIAGIRCRIQLATACGTRRGCARGRSPRGWGPTSWTWGSQTRRGAPPPRPRPPPSAHQPRCDHAAVGMLCLQSLRGMQEVSLARPMHCDQNVNGAAGASAKQPQPAAGAQGGHRDRRRLAACACLPTYGRSAPTRCTCSRFPATGMHMKPPAQYGPSILHLMPWRLHSRQN